MSEHAAPVQATPTPAPQVQATNGFKLQRKCACGSYGSGGGSCDKCRADGKKLQRTAIGPETPDGLPESVHEVLSSSGHPLDQTTRSWMEPRFNYDFSGVRVHTDAHAARSAKEVNALAYTVGRDVVFGTGQYAPGTERGTRLLAHELTHVVQQTSSGSSAQQTSKAVSEPSDAAEVEADAMADRVMSGEAVNVTQAPNATLHALSDLETGLLAGGLAVAGIGGTLLTLWLSGAFDAENYSAQELTAYLTVLATTRRIEDARNSDNKARDVVRHWRAGEAGFNIDNGFSVRGGSLTGVELKRLLIKEMLSGVTAGGDEEAILTILDNTATPDLIQLLDPTQGLSVQDIDRKVDGENHERFNQLLERRLPRTGPNAAPQRQGTGQTCTARQSLMLDYARRRAVEEVQNAIDVLTNNTADAAVQRALACRFPGANATQINDIRGVYERTLAKLPRRIYHCAPEGGEAEMGGLVVTDSTGVEVRIDCLGEYARTYGTNLGTSAQTTIDEVFLCPEFFRQPPDGQVLTVIHESVHAAGLLEDPNYTPPCGIPLSTALINPDSYAFLAHELMSITRRAAAAARQQTGQSIQRKAESEERPDELPEIVDDVLDSPGRPLDSATRAAMEPRFNRDFGGVRVHTDSTAAQSARAVNAHAYTVGQDVVFGAGQYQPQTEEGAHLLAHELTHVVQQSASGPMTAQSSKAISDPSDAAEVEADSVATQVISGEEIVHVNQSPSASLHALNDSETGWLVAGGVVAGGVAAGFIVAAAIGAFDTSRFRNCTPDQQGVVNGATDTARQWIDNAVSVVDRVIANPQEAPSYVVNQLRYHFKITPSDTDNLNRLRQGLAQIQTGFGELLFECDASCGETADTATAARVPGFFGGITLRYGRIHVCPRFFSGPQNPENVRADERPETIAHEMAHRFVGARGDVYRWAHMNQYSRLTTDEALDNADSYAQFARLLFNIGNQEAASETPAEPESTPTASTGASAQRKAIGSGRTLQRRARRQLQRQPAPDTQEPAPPTEAAPEVKQESETTPETQPAQTGGIPQLDLTSGMKGHPAPPGCIDFLWAREYPRIHRLDTISVVALTARSASEKKADIGAARLKNGEMGGALGELCARYETVQHPFRVRFYFLDVEPRTKTGEKIKTQDALANSVLGDQLGATQEPRYRIYVEREMKEEGNFSDIEALDKELKETIDYWSQSGAWRGTKKGFIVGSILGGLTTIGVGIGVGAAVAGAGGGLGAILGFGALAGVVSGGLVFGASAGLGALFGETAGTDRGTKALSKERIKEVQTFVALLKKTGEVKGDTLTSKHADDLARDAVTLWIDKPAELPLTVNDRRLLIKAMMDGPTLDDDERAIIRLIENCADAEILQLLDPTVDEKSRVTVQMLDDEIDGDEWRETRQMLQARFPTLGSPKIDRAGTGGAPPCEGDQAIMILAAYKRATEIMPIASLRLHDYLADPDKHKGVLGKIQCYFTGAKRADVQKIKDLFDRIQLLIPSSRYICPGKKELTIPTPPGPAVEQCGGSDVAYTVAWHVGGVYSAHPETYLCPLFFDNGPVYQATSVIHEWVHRAMPETDIDKYDPKCDGIDLATALVNPDSYALLARDLAEGLSENEVAMPRVSIGNFRNSGAVTPENRCLSCPQIPALGVNPAEGNNFMEVSGDITGHRPDALYDFKRTKEVAIWMRLKGSWQSIDYSPPGTLDDASWADEDVVPKNNRIYS
ncbi:MAG TPA: DUF4157 domain-containing protein, partial [Pyrinomonadaceae bacterium]|nr:DUF4157 domain-containing protein [Pyrinomonadaceae bacterium]